MFNRYAVKNVIVDIISTIPYRLRRIEKYGHEYWGNHVIDLSSREL
jgi:hypothetical protein